MMVRHLWDGFISLLAAIATFVICGVPIWYSYQAIKAGIAPVWVWVPVIGLTVVGVLMVLAFIRKAMSGISPSRERRRR